MPGGSAAVLWAAGRPAQLLCARAPAGATSGCCERAACTCLHVLWAPCQSMCLLRWGQHRGCLRRALTACTHVCSNVGSKGAGLYLGNVNGSYTANYFVVRWPVHLRPCALTSGGMPAVHTACHLTSGQSLHSAAQLPSAHDAQACLPLFCPEEPRGPAAGDSDMRAASSRRCAGCAGQQGSGQRGRLLQDGRRRQRHHLDLHEQYRGSQWGGHIRQPGEPRWHPAQPMCTHGNMLGPRGRPAWRFSGSGALQRWCEGVSWEAAHCKERAHALPPVRAQVVHLLGRLHTCPPGPDGAQQPMPARACRATATSRATPLAGTAPSRAALCTATAAWAAWRAMTGCPTAQSPRCAPSLRRRTSSVQGPAGGGLAQPQPARLWAGWSGPGQGGAQACRAARLLQRGRLLRQWARHSPPLDRRRAAQVNVGGGDAGTTPATLLTSTPSTPSMPSSGGSSPAIPSLLGR